MNCHTNVTHILIVYWLSKGNYSHMEKWGSFDIIIDDFDQITNESNQLERLSNFPYGNGLMTQ